MAAGGCLGQVEVGAIAMPLRCPSAVVAGVIHIRCKNRSHITKLHQPQPQSPSATAIYLPNSPPALLENWPYLIYNHVGNCHESDIYNNTSNSIIQIEFIFGLNF